MFLNKNNLFTFLNGLIKAILLSYDNILGFYVWFFTSEGYFIEKHHKTTYF